MSQPRNRLVREVRSGVDAVPLFVDAAAGMGFGDADLADGLRAAGTAARHELEALLGVRVHLTTRVKVAPDWQQDPRQLGRLGL